MNRLASALAVLLLLAACERAATPLARKPPPPAPQSDAPILENDNLLNLYFGAAVIDRSNEMSYESAVVHALDGTPLTGWRSAPGGKLSTVISLATTTRLRRLGATVPKVDPPAGIVVETSLDGTTWRKTLEKDLNPNASGRQLFDVAPVEARYLRVTLVEPKDYYTSVASLVAIGSETAPFVQPPLEGCWEVNHEPARFERNGARVTGTIGDMIVDGGTDGRMYRLTWREQMNWGYAAVSISPDGNHLSGVRWHEEVNIVYTGDGWIGKRVACSGVQRADGAEIVDQLIRRAAMWRMYGIRFDRQDRIVASESRDALDLAATLVREHPKHRFRIVAREFRELTDAKNKARGETKLAGVREALRARNADLSRIEFQNDGSSRRPLGANFTGQRVMDSSVDLQVLPPQ